MRISFMGKGGSGKTTLTAAFISYLDKKGQQTLAIDGDVNVHLAEMLGHDSKPLSEKMNEVTSFLEPHRTTPIIGTTPPTEKTTFISPKKNDPFIKKFATTKNSVSVLTVGTYQTEDIGFSCYHGKLKVAEMIFHRLLDTKDEVVVADFTAGIDSLGTSLFMVSDINIFVVEPTLKAIKVYTDFKQKAEKENITTYVVMNKILDESDVDFIKSHIPADQIIGQVSFSNLMNKFERGEQDALLTFVDQNTELFEILYKKLSEQKRNWESYYKKLVAIFTINCNEWYNSYYGIDLLTDIDPDFSYQTPMKKNSINK